MRKQRLVIVSNRLPIIVEDAPDGGRRVVSGSGGLVTAMGPVLQDRGGKWVGWLGGSDIEDTEPALEDAAADLGYHFEPVDLTSEEVEGFYEGFANAVLWPLFHDFVTHCNFDPAFWPVYQEANRRFAGVVAEVSNEDDYVWIHDYHLMRVGAELRAMGIERELGFFLHIPFPSLDMFSKLPWRQQLLEGLLDYDLIGFQTQRDLSNFGQCAQALIEGAQVHESDGLTRIEAGGRSVRAGAFPISIDYESFLHRAVENRVSELVARVRQDLPNRTLVLGLDRLDYSKGIPDRIRAFGLALQRYPELHGKITLLQVVIPSRTGVDEYQHLKDEIDRLIGQVSGRYSKAGWAPIQYIFRSLTDVELLAYYRACQVALVTPLKDGMNLVAKEYCACSLEDDGVVILSEFAGAAAQLADGALIVNPFDIEQVADAIHHAATMTPAERAARMGPLRESIARENIYHWVERFLAAAETTRIEASAGPTSFATG
jgi:trehalose 6-phosphate synthase